MVLSATILTTPPPPIQESQIIGLEMSSACVKIHLLTLVTNGHKTALPPQQWVVEMLGHCLLVLPIVLKQRVYGTTVYRVVVPVP
jgi:hypothetical protein